MKEQKTIYFSESDKNSDELSIWLSVKMTWHYLKLSLKKISLLINDVVHKYSWTVLLLTILISSVISDIYIGMARAERDKSYQKQYRLEQKIKSLQCQLEVQK